MLRATVIHRGASGPIQMLLFVPLGLRTCMLTVEPKPLTEIVHSVGQLTELVHSVGHACLLGGSSNGGGGGGQRRGGEEGKGCGGGEERKDMEEEQKEKGVKKKEDTRIEQKKEEGTHMEEEAAAAKGANMRWRRRVRRCQEVSHRRGGVTRLGRRSVVVHLAELSAVCRSSHQRWAWGVGHSLAYSSGGATCSTSN